LKRVVVSVINDLSFDQRVDKVCSTLTNNGFDVLLIGRKRKESIPVSRSYQTYRMNLLFTKGALFYAFFNLRLFFKLLFVKADVFHANDLDTLLANRWASKLRRKSLVYDSHEYFTGVPEIQNRPKIKMIWEKIERAIFPKLKHIFTVNQSIADLYSSQYNKDVQVLRNVPRNDDLKKTKSRTDLGIPLDKKIVLVQGTGINIDRGIEELLDAISIMEDTVLYIVGSGDVLEHLRARSQDADLIGKVVFIGKLPYHEMMQYTYNADVGVTLDKDTNINYRFSLPNKIFDYIKAGLPVLSSDLVELKKIINQYEIGVITPDHSPEEIKKSLLALWDNDSRFSQYKENTIKAAAELTWEKEVEILIDVYRKL
jgi:glycosyltransferase involved in cell wall biosynthesis